MEELEDVLMFFMDEEGIEIKLIQGPPDETKIKRDINAGFLKQQQSNPEIRPNLSSPHLLLLKRRAKAIEHNFQCETRKECPKD